MTGYVELAVTTNFSFLRGASHAEELIAQAVALGLSGIGVADRNSFAGVVRAHIVAKETNLNFFVGVRLVTIDGFETLAYPKDRAAYGHLCRLLTRGKRKAEKGECEISLDDILEFSEDQIFIVLSPAKLERRASHHPSPPSGEVLSLSEAKAKRKVEVPTKPPLRSGSPDTRQTTSPVNGGGKGVPSFAEQLRRLRDAAPGRVYLGSTALYENRAEKRLAVLAVFAREMRVPLVAANDVHYHVPERQQLQDILTCIREKCTIDEAGKRLAQNAERHLKSPKEMARLFAKYPDAVARTMEIANQLNFSLEELKYEYPDEAIGGGPPQETLARLAWEGAAKRYPNSIPEKVRKLIAHELALIDELHYAPYFLTVWDIVAWARGQGILCQGRGSAANSAVCYMLGITAVDPTQMDLLFERFVSTERNEPPDIDVDFEHERREEVIQHIYEKYGRHSAGITATVISYRNKSAIRDVGKALGLSEDMVGLLSGNLFSWGRSMEDVRVEEVGLDAADPRLAMALNLARELYGFPRHLSQHVGGFVITRGPLEELVPIGNAAMEDRTFIEWDKDDIDALGILKIDVLALGMLTAIAKSFALLQQHYDLPLELATVPREDPAVYDMLCEADSIGVFQVESRAQMSMLPRLRPREFFDLVIEVAIVRPGPIQGDMVHPYLRRREGIETVSFPTRELEEALKPTLGVPLFQEQAMKIAIVAAGFTPAEADKLRRAMATFKRSGTIPKFREKFIEGMIARGYEREFAERCFHQIEGFADYGFPMSHAASFAQLVYVSAWIKRHYPDVFCAAMLNAQPMGFYAPAQLVRDAAMHGVEIREPDINASEWDYTLEHKASSLSCGKVASNQSVWGADRCSVRLGFRQIKGFREDDAKALVAARGRGFDGVRHLALAANLPSEAMARLAEADAFRSLGLDRREALWCVKGLDGAAENSRIAVPELPIFQNVDAESLRREEEVRLPPLCLGEHIVQDYMALSMSLKAHPLSLLRTKMHARGITPNAKIIDTPDGARITVAGLVLVRQRPGTASGVIFITLEDEASIANIIVWPKVFETYRRTLLASRLLMVTGKLQKQGIVTHVIADKLVDLTSDLSLLSVTHGDKCEALARADQLKHDGQGSWRDAPHRHRRDTQAIPKSRDFR
ncbi:MAG TPA: error-prone DNA polymerase [Rhizomicrobium sp.]|jgi:error-prone DNA polymerase|nr:error-prone DNA polymerase [Rhizomicrobium sp.]